MARKYKYNINEDGIGKVSLKDEEAPYSDKTLPKDHPMRGKWNISEGGKKKKSKKT